MEINSNILDEMRRERKIMLVLRDKGISNYINTDITQINILNPKENENLDLKIQDIVKDKLEFRNNLA